MARWLAYAHPTWMLASLAVAALALRSGLALRRSRQGRMRRTPEMRAAHLRFAKPAVALVLVGFVGGVGSSVFLRGFEALHTFHGVLGLLVAGLFVAAAAVGHRLELHGSRAFSAHALLASLALLLAALAAVAGFVLLP